MPASWTALDADPDTGDSELAAVQELEARTIDLRHHFAGADPPDDPVEGDVWVYTGATPNEVRVYADIGAGLAWVAVNERLARSINADPDAADGRAAPYPFLALMPESVAAPSTPTATNAGLLERKTADGEFYVADQPVAGTTKALLSVVPGQSLDTVELALDGSMGNDATHPPTVATKTALQGWLFDDTNEKRTFLAPVPKNWHGASDLELRLHQVLDAAETGGDDIEWSGEIRVLAPAAGKASQTATTLVDASTDIGADADGIAEGGGPHVTSLVIDHDDVDNPVSAGSLLCVTVWRKTVGGAGKVAGVLVYRAEIAYAQKARHERA